jgi:hypothetical protein
MGRSGIETLLYTLDRNFAAPGPTFGTWHSFLVNLADVRDDDWLWVPEEAERSIFEIVQHVGETKYVYDSCTFEDGSVHWQRGGSVPTIDESTPRDEVVRWLETGHQQFRDHVAALEDDSELELKRSGLWNDEHETRWLITQVIQHDRYHAGEINHIRALRHRNDNWGNEP